MKNNETKELNQRIQSVEVGFTILCTLAKNKGAMTLSELAKATEMHKSQLYRYLNSFVHLGVLTREEAETPNWKLGPELILLGNAAFENIDLTRLAAPLLIELRNILNETVALSIWRDQGAFFVQWETSNRQVNIGLDMGSYVPLYTATGKVFRAFLPEEKTEFLYQQEVRYGSINPEKYDPEIVKIRHFGISKTESSLIPGISAISTPVFYPGGKLAGALSIIGFKGFLETEPNAKPVQELIKAADSISRQLGLIGEWPLQSGQIQEQPQN